jgi:hypothetical protein
MKENYYSCVVSYAELSKKMEILSRWAAVRTGYDTDHLQHNK